MPEDNSIQEQIEDRTFQNLIRKYTKARDWAIVRALFFDWGQVLEDRDK